MADRIADLIVRLRADSSGLDRALDTTTKRVKSQSLDLEKSLNRVGTTFRNVAASIGVGFSVVGIVRFTRSVLDATVATERIQRALKAATGSATAGAEEYAFVREMADRLGLSLLTTADAYAQFAASARGTAIEGELTREIFEAVAGAATVLGLSAERSGRVFTALTQIISKGKVQAEEVRNQLGESLPGAFQLFAKAAQAAGISVTGTTAELDKLLEQGKVGLEVLPFFADEINQRYGKEIPDAVNSTQAALNRLETAIFDLKQQIGNAGFVDALTDAIRDFTDFLGQPSTVASVEDLATAVGDIAREFFELARSIPGALQELESFVESPAFRAVAGAYVGGRIAGLPGAVVGASAAALISPAGTGSLDEARLRRLGNFPDVRGGDFGGLAQPIMTPFGPLFPAGAAPPRAPRTPIPFDSTAGGGGGSGGGKAANDAKRLAEQMQRDRERAEETLTKIAIDGIEQRLKAQEREADLIGLRATAELAQLDELAKIIPEKEAELQAARIQVIQGALAQIEKIETDAAEKLAKEQERLAKERAEEIGKQFAKLGNFVGDTIGGLLLQQERDWDAFFRSLAASFVSSGIQNLFAELAGGFAARSAGGGGGGGGGLLGTTLGLLGGLFFAKGGVVSRPTLGVVGEAGPEAVIPLDRLDRMLAQQKGGIVVNIIGAPPGTHTEERGRDSQGRDVLDVIVGGANLRNAKRGLGRQRHAPGSIGG